MRIQQSFPNPYSRLQQKRYGYDHSQLSWIERHGAKIGTLLCLISVAVIITAAVWLAPTAIEHEQDMNRAAVAANIGVQ